MKYLLRLILITTIANFLMHFLIILHWIVKKKEIFLKNVYIQTASSNIVFILIKR